MAPPCATGSRISIQLRDGKSCEARSADARDRSSGFPHSAPIPQAAGRRGWRPGAPPAAGASSPSAIPSSANGMPPSRSAPRSAAYRHQVEPRVGQRRRRRGRRSRRMQREPESGEHSGGKACPGAGAKRADERSQGVVRVSAMPTPNWKNATPSTAVAVKPAIRRCGLLRAVPRRPGARGRERAGSGSRRRGSGRAEGSLRGRVRGRASPRLLRHRQKRFLEAERGDLQLREEVRRLGRARRRRHRRRACR